jgi:hypothetical protein
MTITHEYKEYNKIIPLSSLLYFTHKYKNNCIVLPLNDIEIISIIKRNKNWSYYFDNISLVFRKSTNDIKVPDNFWENFTKCINKAEIRFIIFSFAFLCEINAHANTMVYDTKSKSLERFEPHGYNLSDSCINYQVDDMILKLFNEHMGKDFVKKYYKPIDFCPKANVQIIESREISTGKKFDPEGFCLIWSYFYIDLRLANPDIDRKQLIINLIYQITNNEKSFRGFIRQYYYFLILIRNKILEGVEKGDDIDNILTQFIKDISV